MRDLIEFLHNLIISDSTSTNFNGRVLEVPESTTLKKHLDNNSILFQSEDNVLSINLRANFSDGLLLFYDESDFLKRYEEKMTDDFDEISIFILNSKSGYLIKAKEEKYDSKLSLIFNFDAYLRILKFIVNSTDFISYSIPEKHEFILIDDQGPTEIKYDPQESRVTQLEDLRPIYLRLTEKFEQFEFQEFFKSAVLNSIKKFDLHERFFRIVLGLSIFLDSAEKDYRIYIKRFAFDKIKSRFKEERIKYFESIEKNLDSINKQVLAFPLTFSATIFASYQVKEKPYILFLILLVYSLYTIIAWMVLNVSYQNLKSVKNDVSAESETIKKIELAIYEDFKEDFTKIYKKITQLNRLIIMLRFTLITLLILFTVFVLYQAGVETGVEQLKELFTEL